MPPSIQNQGQIAQNVDDEYTSDAQQPDADVSSGTVARDLVDASTLQIAQAYTAMETARQASSLKNSSSATQDGMSRYAMNFDVLRKPATAATGVVTFQSSVQPGSNISIPAGTVVQAPPLADGTVVSYQTTAAATLGPSAPRNLVTGLYEIDVPVAAVLVGTASQVGVNSLTVLPSRISGVTSVTNKQAISNAYDGDTNATVASSVRAKTNGSLIGTATGYEALLLSTFPSFILGVSVVGPLDPQNTRVQYGNEVDVPIISTDAASFTSVLTVSGSQTTPFGSVRPVLSVSTVVGATNGVNYQRNVDWGFQQDTGPVYGFSTKSFDALCWFPSRQPGLGIALTVQGVYDAGVVLAQSYLNQPTVNYITGGLLVKSAQMVLVNVGVSVLAASGTSASQLAIAISAAISTALSAYTLGQNVLEDDLVNVINAVPGVSSVVIPFTTLNTAASPISGSSVNITKYQYARPGAISVSVS